MKCAHAQDLLDDYLLGELDPDVEIQLNTHLDECDVCKKILREREECIQELQSTMVFEAKASAFQRVTDNVTVPCREGKFIWIFPKQLIYAFGAFLFGIVVMRVADVFLWKQPESSQVETNHAPTYKGPFTDTVQFYNAPAKHLARS